MKTVGCAHRKRRTETWSATTHDAAMIYRPTMIHTAFGSKERASELGTGPEVSDKRKATREKRDHGRGTKEGGRGKREEGRMPFGFT